MGVFIFLLIVTIILPAVIVGLILYEYRYSLGKVQKPEPVKPVESWTCTCGTVNTSDHCSFCGMWKPGFAPEKTKPMYAKSDAPVKNEPWRCSGCGHTNTGKFCTLCGRAMPVKWVCVCGHTNSGNVCSFCGTRKPEVKVVGVVKPTVVKPADTQKPVEAPKPVPKKTIPAEPEMAPVAAVAASEIKPEEREVSPVRTETPSAVEPEAVKTKTPSAVEPESVKTEEPVSHTSIYENYDSDGYNIYGYDKDGFDKNGFDRNGYDKDGYDSQGYDKKGYDRNGYDLFGYDKQGYNKDGYDQFGLKKEN